MIGCARFVPVIFVLMIAATTAAAQTPSIPEDLPNRLTLAGAIDYASSHYPTIKAAIEEVSAASANVDVARDAYLPRVDSVWQSNRATANNIFGQLLPQSVIPALTGPVLAATSAESVWSSAAGALFSWEPADFGLRHAAVTSAEVAVTRARAAEALTRLDIEQAVASTFLAAVAAERAVAAAQADVERRSVLRQAIETLVDAQLRPGADASRVDAERAAAQTRLIQAQQNLVVARITLTRWLGHPGAAVTLDPQDVGGRLPAIAASTTSMASHPAMQLREAAVEQARVAEQLLAKTNYPRLYLQGSVFARGSGANTTEPFETGLGGLRFDRANWAAGAQIVFPNVFDFASLRARKTAAAATTRAELALRDDTTLTLTSQQQTAAAVLDSARAIAANTPIQLVAARQSESQARARYDAGLTSIVEVADAQSLLAQAEVQDELARIEVWRALLATAVAQGDLTPFRSLLR